VVVRNLEDQQCRPDAGRPSGDVQRLIEAAGNPVYPESNAAEHSYANVLEGLHETVAVYPGTFTILPGGILVFVASRVSGNSRGPAFIVSLSLRGGTSAPKEYSLERAAESLGLKSAVDIEITGAAPAGEKSVRLQLQKGAYKEDSIILPLN
jgi:hypothetical protein